MNTIRAVRSFLEERTMKVRIGETFSSARKICGGSPQGSILRGFLFSITTDNLTENISYDMGGVNTCHASQDSPTDYKETIEHDARGDLVLLDLSLARIVSDTESSLGINNITVEAEPISPHTWSFAENRLAAEYVTEELLPREYNQSTPNTRGQFARFIPPGNLVSSAISGEYSSTTGQTFAFLPRGNGLCILSYSLEEARGPLQSSSQTLTL